MRRQALIFEARRAGYSIDQVKDDVMTIGELKEILEDYTDDTLVVISHDNGYTFGGLEVAYEASADEDGNFED